MKRLAALMLCLILAACTPAAPAVLTPTSTPAPTATPVPTPGAVQPKLGLSALTPCKEGGGFVDAECGWLGVRENRDDPNSRILMLHVVLVRARNASPAPDPLFYLAGGPGGASTSHVDLANSIFFSIHADRDIVFVDQRGTADGHKLSCDPIPFTVADASQQQVDEYMKKCLASLNGDPRFYTTAAAMQDLDEARAALGYDKINLYGISYGVTAEQVYMRMFPEHVRAAVLDHGTALDVPFLPMMAPNSQAALDHVFTLCKQDKKCDAAYPDLQSDWEKVLARVDKGPVKTSYIPTGATEPAEVSRETVVTSVHQILFKSGGYTMLPGIIHNLAVSEDWTAIVKSVSENMSGGTGGESGFLLMYNEIICFEPWWGTDIDKVTSAEPTAYMHDQEVSEAKAQLKICNALAKPDEKLIYPKGEVSPSKSKISILALNSYLDPQNPPTNMEGIKREFSNTFMIRERFEGHETGSTGCRWNTIAAFIDKGDSTSLDLSCFEQQTPPAFR